MSTLLYDPDCGFCQRCARFAQRYLALGVDLQPGVPDELIAHRIDRDRFLTGLPYITDGGQVAYGALALGLALKTSRRAPVRWAGLLLLAAPVRPLAHRLYLLVAQNRYRLPGSTGTCNLPR